MSDVFELKGRRKLDRSP